jgi:hypothetical protein
MSANEELNSIKKKYGESFMHVCRELFPTMLEDDGLLSSILADYFATNNRDLGETIREKRLESQLKEFILSKVNDKKERIDTLETTDKDPYELLNEVGYQLFECRTEEDIQEFKKYYADGEELCTFNGGRLDRDFVFFAVKKNALELDRKSFKKPKREDEYSTSVISIQFTKERRTTVSIKSRYNHTVENPDATYGNDLDRIVPGLADSFTRLIKSRGYFYSDANVEKLHIPGFVVGPDKKYYKYNVEVGGFYFCPGNIVIDGSRFRPEEDEKNHMIIMDNYILDIKKKKFLTSDDELWYFGIKDSFVDSFAKPKKIIDENGYEDVKLETKISKIVVKKNFQRKENRIVELYLKGKENDEPVIIELNKNNQIVGYSNKYATRIGNRFMENNTTLEWIDLPNVVSIGDKFLAKNNSLKAISLPKVERIGSEFLHGNKVLEEMNAPELREVGDWFLADNREMRIASFPKVEIIGDQFMMNNRELHTIEIPRVVRIGNHAFTYNMMISEVSCPRVKEVGRGFCENNELIHRIYMPEVEKIGSSFCYSNTQMEEIDFPSLVEISSHFFASNEIVKRISLAKAKVLGNYFMQNNLYAKIINLPEATDIKDLFMCTNVIAREINAPKVENIGEGFMLSNTQMKIVNMQSAVSVAGVFLPEAKEIEVMNMHKLKDAPLSLKRRVSEVKKQKFVSVINTIPMLFNKLNSKDIAELDKESKVSRTEVRMSKNILKKIIEMCKSKTR